MNLDIKNSIINLNNKLGIRTEFYAEDFEMGGYAEGDTIYLNELSGLDLMQVDKHEILHFYETTKTFKAARANILSAFTDDEMAQKQKEYFAKYYKLCSVIDIQEGLLDTEIAIDAMIGNGKFSNKVISVAANEVLKIFSEKITKLESRRYLSLSLYNRSELEK